MALKCVYKEEIIEGLDEYSIYHEYRPAGWYVFAESNDYDIVPPLWWHMNEMIFWENWCKENLTYEWNIDCHRIYMKNIEDATLFKIICLS